MMAGRKRNRTEFIELLEPVRHAMYDQACWDLWDKSLVADVMQEAVLAAWRNFSGFEARTNFRAWIFQILVNKIYNFNRRISRSRELPLAKSAENMFAAMEREDAWDALLRQPDALAPMLDDRLVLAFRSINANERHCFFLHQIQGLTYKEIASVLDVPLGTVMSYMHRARKNLREQLASLAVEHGLVKEAE